MAQSTETYQATPSVDHAIDTQAILSKLEEIRAVHGLPRTANRPINDIYRLLGHKPPHEQARDQRNHARRQRQAAHHTS